MSNKKQNYKLRNFLKMLQMFESIVEKNKNQNQKIVIFPNFLLDSLASCELILYISQGKTTFVWGSSNVYRLSGI